MKTDYKKMLAQEPDFKNFCADAVLDVFARTQPDFIAFLKSMYDIGMPPKDVARVIENMTRQIGGGK